MEDEKTDNLQSHFRKSVPVGFIEQLLRRQEWIYKEAHEQCFKNTIWTEAEARWMLGDTMRAIFEGEMRRAAIEHGPSWQNADHFANNCTYLKVFAGNFRITAHRVVSPGSFVEPCESRKQDAAVNQFLNEYVQEGLLCAPLPKLAKAKEIVIYLLHGTTKNIKNERTPFLEFAAPDFELAGVYRWNSSALELKQAYLADARKLKSEASVEDQAKPKPKRRADEASS